MVSALVKYGGGGGDECAFFKLRNGKRSIKKNIALLRFESAK